MHFPLEGAFYFVKIYKKRIDNLEVMGYINTANIINSVNNTNNVNINEGYCIWIIKQFNSNG